MNYETVVAEIQRMRSENHKRWDDAIEADRRTEATYCDGYAKALTDLWETLQNMNAGQS